VRFLRGAVCCVCERVVCARKCECVCLCVGVYRVLSYISAAEAGGAQILLDGRSWAKSQQKGFWVGPTVILHNNRNDAALKDEIFGPVLSVYKVSSMLSLYYQHPQ
jgi:acyl-CoA reductase-like NAD-dependent aldehyde dehydrogenase